jgi:CubicO group peptidase (beta-lactamase class C family)
MSRVARENLWNEVISHKVASYAEGVRIHLAEAARVEKLAARVTKQSFREWTDANLFRPLGMTRTHFCDDAAEIVPHRAAYYTSEAKGQLHEFVSQLAAPGSSSLLTTAEDMGRWLINFGSAHVGGIGAIQLMQQPGKVNAGKSVDYGFGLGLESYHGMKAEPISFMLLPSKNRSTTASWSASLNAAIAASKSGAICSQTSDSVSFNKFCTSVSCSR